MEHIIIKAKYISLKYRTTLFFAKFGNNKIFRNVSKMEKYLRKISNSDQQNQNHFIIPLTCCDVKKYYDHNMDIVKMNSKGIHTIVYLHGGAFIKRPKNYQFWLVDKIAKNTNSQILIPMYPLAPKYDAKECVNILVEFISNLPDKEIYLIGDSSGGALAFSLNENLQNRNIKKIKKIIAISPWLDVSLANSEIYIKYQEKEGLVNPLALNKITQIWLDKKDYLNPMYNGIHAEKLDDIEIMILNGTEELFAIDIRNFCEHHIDQNIKWIEFEKLSYCFPFSKTIEGHKNLKIIYDFINTENEIIVKSL